MYCYGFLSQKTYAPGILIKSLYSFIITILRVMTVFIAPQCSYLPKNDIMHIILQIRPWLAAAVWCRLSTLATFSRTRQRSPQRNFPTFFALQPRASRLDSLAMTPAKTKGVSSKIQPLKQKKEFSRHVKLPVKMNIWSKSCSNLGHQRDLDSELAPERSIWYVWHNMLKGHGLWNVRIKWLHQNLSRSCQIYNISTFKQSWQD